MIGDNYTAEVISVSESYKPKYTGYGTRPAIVLEYKTKFGIRDNLVFTIYYDKDTGLLLGIIMTFENGEGQIEISLTDTNIPTTPGGAPGGGEETTPTTPGETTGESTGLEESKILLYAGVGGAIVIIGIALLYIVRRR